MRSVIHWDGDSFFASVEQASDRRLRGRPVAVGGEKRGVVLSVSTEARRYGIRPGFAMHRARRLCPPLIVLPGHFDLYEQFSQQIIGLCEDTTPLVEPAGVGAAWLDLTGTENALHGTPDETILRLRRTVKDWLKVSISAGVATNKTVARLAARVRKPSAQMVVQPGQERMFMAPLPVRLLPGIGRESAATLQIAGVRTIGELAQTPIDAIAMVLGRDALRLQRRAQGVDEDPVRKPERGGEVVFREFEEFAEDLWDERLLLPCLRTMLERLMAQVRAAKVEVRRLTLMLRYTDRDEAERSVTLKEPTCVETDFQPLVPEMVRKAWERRVRLRAVSMKASRVYAPSPQMSLFDPKAVKPNAALAAAIDKLRKQYGEKIVQRAAVQVA